MDIGSELFSMAFALKLQRVAHPTAEASSLKLSDASTVDNNFFLGSDNIKVIFYSLVYYEQHGNNFFLPGRFFFSFIFIVKYQEQINRPPKHT